MFRFFRLRLGALASAFHSHQSLLLENLALRQQVAVLKRRHPRPKLSPLDKLFWGEAIRVWSAWKRCLLLVTPETVVRWHRAGFRMYWTWLSKMAKPRGRTRISSEIRDLIFRMVVENPTWGAPRIHGELRMLGFDVAERTISRWRKRAPHFNVTRHPTSTWIVQQLREAFPYQSAPKFLIFDHDRKYGLGVAAAVRCMRITSTQTSIRSPWQNGVAERWVGSCRRDLLDRTIAVDEPHLRRLSLITSATTAGDRKASRALAWKEDHRHRTITAGPAFLRKRERHGTNHSGGQKHVHNEVSIANQQGIRRNGACWTDCLCQTQARWGKAIRA